MTDVCCSIAFEVAGEAVAKGNLRTSRSGHAYYPNGAKVRPWATRIADAAAVQMGDGGPLWRGPVRLFVTFALPRPKGHYGSGRNAGVVRSSAPAFPIVLPDVDKLVRTVLDALTGVVYADDAQVVGLDVSKSYAGGDVRPGVQVTAYEYKEPARV